MNDDSALVSQLRAQVRSLQASVEQLEDEVEGRRAIRRNRARRNVRRGGAGVILCPCGGTLHDAGQLDEHIDHIADAMTEAEAGQRADRSW
jgi:Asp/Glu/hydantoin racemase